MTRKATTDHPIHDLIASRWSPRRIGPKPVSQEDLMSVLEAARWAASSYNVQPWRFLVADKTQDPAAHKALQEGINEFNQTWATQAPVLIVVCATPINDKGDPNAYHKYDTGAATAQLTLEATARGLCVHQMAGILPDKLRQAGNIPDDLEILAALVLGYHAEEIALPEMLQQKEAAPRQRKPLSQITAFGKFEG